MGKNPGCIHTKFDVPFDHGHRDKRSQEFLDYVYNVEDTITEVL
jgi:hypothetical protein